MRVYHFLSKSYGLQAIENRKIKISRLVALNDPFEFFCLNTDNYVVRKTLQERRNRASRSFGILCFSGNRDSPVQWTHYADSHRGLCLGFDIPESKLIEVEYVEERASESEFNEALSYRQFEFLRRMVSRKYIHWEYEQERRMLVRISAAQEADSLVFESFSGTLRLKEVLIGHRCSLSKKKLTKLLGKYDVPPEVDLMLPSNTEFKMERSKDLLEPNNSLRARRP